MQCRKNFTFDDVEDTRKMFWSMGQTEQRKFLIRELSESNNRGSNIMRYEILKVTLRQRKLSQTV